MKPSAADPELVYAVPAGDRAAFAVMTTRYERKICSLADRRLQKPRDADDLTLPAVLSAVENLAKFREAAPFAAFKIMRQRTGLVTVSS